MNDTDIYADQYRVDYHPDPGIEDPATHPSNPKGQRPTIGVRRGGETA